MDGTFLSIFDGVCICNPHSGALLVVSSKFKGFAHQGSRAERELQTQTPTDSRSGHCVARVTSQADQERRRHLLTERRYECLLHLSRVPVVPSSILESEAEIKHSFP
jgi:hypothetical protein